MSNKTNNKIITVGDMINELQKYDKDLPLVHYNKPWHYVEVLQDIKTSTAVFKSQTLPSAVTITVTYVPYMYEEDGHYHVWED